MKAGSSWPICEAVKAWSSPTAQRSDAYVLRAVERHLPDRIDPELGRSQTWVSVRLDAMKSAMLEQAVEAELPLAVREKIEHLLELRD